MKKMTFIFDKTIFKGAVESLTYLSRGIHVLILLSTVGKVARNS